MEGAEVPLTVVCEFAHGAAQDAADALRIDLLHVKGAALDPRLSWPTRTFSDADVLVRPAQVERWLEALAARGWEVETSFVAGSPFAHASTMVHPTWGYLDVHRWWPGLDLPPDEAFDALWEHRRVDSIAGLRCAVPQLVDQAVIQCLHLARSGQPDLHHHPALQACWSSEDPSLRARIDRRVLELRAEVAYSVLDGTLEHHAGHPDQPLWRAISRDEGRVAEWLARARRERTVTGTLRVLLRAFLVNREHLTAERGRPATRLEVAREFASRLVRGVREMRR